MKKIIVASLLSLQVLASSPYSSVVFGPGGKSILLQNQLCLRDGVTCFTTGTTSPGGLTTQIQYNNSGAFAGSSDFTWNNSTKLFSVNGHGSFEGGNIATTGGVWQLGSSGGLSLGGDGSIGNLNGDTWGISNDGSVSFDNGTITSNGSGLLTAGALTVLSDALYLGSAVQWGVGGNLSYLNGFLSISTGGAIQAASYAGNSNTPAPMGHGVDLDGSDLTNGGTLYGNLAADHIGYYNGTSLVTLSSDTFDFLGTTDLTNIDNLVAQTATFNGRVDFSETAFHADSDFNGHSINSMGTINLGGIGDFIQASYLHFNSGTIDGVDTLTVGTVNATTLTGDGSALTNVSAATTPVALTGEIAYLGGRLYQSLSQLTSAGTSETDLHSFTVVANTLDDQGQTLHFRSSGQFLASAFTKRVRAYFGGTLIYDTGALGITGSTDWVLEGEIMRLNSSSQKCSVTFISSSATLSASAKYTNTAISTGSSAILKTTGTEGATGGNDIVEEYFKVNYENRLP